jgi:predicted nucleotidyltransferase
MRLSPSEINAIRAEVQRVDPTAEVYLFGSRADDTARGGDIDLWVRSSRISFADELSLLTRIKDRIGCQKIDLIVNDGEDHPLARVVEKSGIKL